MPAEPSSLVHLLQAARRTRRRFALTVLAGVLGAGTLAGLLREAAAAWPMSRAQAQSGAALKGNASSATAGQLRRCTALAAQDLSDQAGALSLHDRGE